MSATLNGDQPTPGINYLRDNPSFDLSQGPISQPELRQLLDTVAQADVVAVVYPDGEVVGLKCPPEPMPGPDGRFCATAVSIRVADPIRVVPLELAVAQLAAGKPILRAQRRRLATVLQPMRPAKPGRGMPLEDALDGLARLEVARRRALAEFASGSGNE